MLDATSLSHTYLQTCMSTKDSIFSIQLSYIKMQDIYDNMQDNHVRISTREKLC